jgi:predicted Zn-dependent peptidase
MVEFKKYTLGNGLKVVVNEDKSTPLTAMSILYNVGSRDEDPELTGIAHLFEHLMFSGSENIPEYDTPLQLAGGENNAFTNNDVTVYYLSLPSENIETGFWLESDRMLGLNFSEENMEVQKRVVCEEFKQRYLNQPYGDVMHLLRKEAYRVHPYRWPTIGREIAHVEKVTLTSIREFFFSHYAPNNAILSVSGNTRPERVLELAEKWFGTIPPRKIQPRNLPAEPKQERKRTITYEKDVPADLLYKAWHICPREHEDFRVLDLFTDVLAGGESGKLYEELVRDKKIFSDINAYITGDIDPGLLLIYGKLMDGTDIYYAEEEVNRIIESFRSMKLQEQEMEKVKNKFEASAVLSNLSILGKATSLAQYELLGDAALINSEVERYRSVTQQSVCNAVERYMSETNCTAVYYKKKKK